ncbi:MAG: response regulator [Desulfamplus sp.]|nr:response regulator [Desulfamplus sp.]
MKILIVDDNSAVLKVSTKTIQFWKHQVTTAENGQEGWDIFSNDPMAFDMILSDIKMPVMDGFELLERVRQHNFETPFVIMTAFDDKTTIIKALKQGATDFLTKPYNREDLCDVLNRIESMLNMKRHMNYTLPFTNTSIHVSIPSRINLIPGLIGFLQSVAKPYYQLYGINDVNSYDLSTSLSEALTNAIIHGNLNISSALKNESWEKFQEVVEEREFMPEYGGKLVAIDFQVLGIDDENLAKTSRH